MKIIILGAGQVGGTLAEHLANEENDITVVDINEERLRELQNRLDIRTVIGTASYPNILRQAGGEEAVVAEQLANAQVEERDAERGDAGLLKGQARCA